MKILIPFKSMIIDMMQKECSEGQILYVVQVHQRRNGYRRSTLRELRDFVLSEVL